LNNHKRLWHLCAFLLNTQRVATRSRSGMLAALLAISALTSIPAQQSIPASRNDHDLRLTPATPSIERATTIVAPGARAHSYNVFAIDTEAFAQGALSTSTYRSLPTAEPTPPLIYVQATSRHRHRIGREEDRWEAATMFGEAPLPGLNTASRPDSYLPSDWKVIGLAQRARLDWYGSGLRYIDEHP
jgi:hypothetical protein